MPHAEVIFENGAHSTMSYDSEDELKGFVENHQNRAKTGEPGASQNQTERMDIGPEDFAIMPSLDVMKDRPAERIHSVLLYDQHPIDAFDSSSVSADTVKSLVDGMAKDGRVDHEQLIRALRDEVSPVYPHSQGRQASMYKAQETGSLDLGFLNGDA